MKYDESFKEKNFLFIDSLYYDDTNKFSIDIFLKDLQKIVYQPRVVAMTHFVEGRIHGRKGLYVVSDYSNQQYEVLISAKQEIFEQICVGLSYLDIDDAEY